MKVFQYLNRKNSDMELSYLEIRKAVGVLGIILPGVLYFGTKIIGPCPTLQPSISHYYYTITGCVLVGILCGVALFLFSYKGYDNWDRIASNIACLGALGVAFFPTNMWNDSHTCAIICRDTDQLRNGIHYGSAGLFFVVISCMSLFLFTRHDKSKEKTIEKRRRNLIYRICGGIMVFAILMILLTRIESIGKILEPYKPTFWFESIALWAFGFSWLTKGEAILKDKKNHHQPKKPLETS